MLALLPGLAGAATLPTQAEALFDSVAERAEAMAAEPHRPETASLPEALENLDYDTYRQIRFRPEAALWRDEGLFSVQLFHSGFLFDTPVRLNLVENGEVIPLDFDPQRFRYDDAAAGLLEHDLQGSGHAGFRLHYPLNRGDYQDEFLVFQGASYFRMVGRDQGYGLSARGLAIDTASPAGEEFPAFREFWLFQPEPDASHIEIVALLDSPSLAGAYRFSVHPGDNIKVDVEARLFARHDVEKLGLAPLTSMFMFGEVSPYPADDFRRQVHDSQGLLMQTHAGEWIWRPLSNPGELRVSRLRDENPQGFGLVQRERDFDAYLDLESRYERRPSHWITPSDDWGPGGLELVEIPSDSEINDNIVTYWVPEEPLRAGEGRTFRYRVATFDAHRSEEILASVVRTRQGWGAIPGQSDPPPHSRRQFIVDFRGEELSTLHDTHPVTATLDVSRGDSHELQVHRLPDGDTWRASFRLEPDGDSPADMRLRLTLRDRPLTETWNFVWNPDELR
jgi:glucans biosynthesis protein